MPHSAIFYEDNVEKGKVSRGGEDLGGGEKLLYVFRGWIIPSLLADLHLGEEIGGAIFLVWLWRKKLPMV